MNIFDYIELTIKNWIKRIKLNFVKNYIREQVIQGFDHAQNITDMYILIREAVFNEFTEDNKPTLDCFLQERFDIAQDHEVKPNYYWNTEEIKLDN